MKRPLDYRTRDPRRHETVGSSNESALIIIAWIVFVFRISYPPHNGLIVRRKRQWSKSSSRYGWFRSDSDPTKHRPRLPVQHMYRGAATCRPRTNAPAIRARIPFSSRDISRTRGIPLLKIVSLRGNTERRNCRSNQWARSPLNRGSFIVLLTKARWAIKTDAAEVFARY